MHDWHHPGWTAGHHESACDRSQDERLQAFERPTVQEEEKPAEEEPEQKCDRPHDGLGGEQQAGEQQGGAEPQGTQQRNDFDNEQEMNPPPNLRHRPSTLWALRTLASPTPNWQTHLSHLPSRPDADAVTFHVSPLQNCLI